MTADAIRKSVESTLSEIDTHRNDESIENALEFLDELVEKLEEKTSSDVDADSEYQDIMSVIEDAQHILNEELDGIYNAEDDYEY
jgi:hypothetical protein